MKDKWKTKNSVLCIYSFVGREQLVVWSTIHCRERSPVLGSFGHIFCNAMMQDVFVQQLHVKLVRIDLI